MKIVLAAWPQYRLVLTFECQIFHFCLPSISSITIKLRMLACSFSFGKMHFGLSMSMNCSLWKPSWWS